LNHRFSDSSRAYRTCIHQFYSLFTATVWGRLPFGCEPWRAAQCTTPECVLLHIQLVYAFNPIASYSTCILLQSSVRCASGRVSYTAYTHFFHFLLNTMVKSTPIRFSAAVCSTHHDPCMCIAVYAPYLSVCVLHPSSTVPVWGRLPSGYVPRCAAHITTPVCVLQSIHRIYLYVYCIQLPVFIMGGLRLVGS